MKIKRLWLLALAVALALGLRFGPKLVMSSEARTRAYFGVQRAWMTHWPFERGKYAPRYLLPAVMPVTPIWQTVEPNVRMYLDPQEYVARAILESGEWESESWHVMRESLPVGGTFVDVGAQIGYYSLKAAQVVGPAGHVIAIEPNPETLQILNGNVQASNPHIVSVAPVACSDKEDMLEFFASAEANTGESSFSKANASQSGVTHSYKVRARPLDDVVRESGVTRVDVIKIDVEGAEYLVLQGSRETLAKFKPAVLVEIIDHQLKEMGSSAEQVRQFFREHGYAPRRLVGDNVEFVAASAGARL
jgi:FkbM family methyltransferase